MSETWLLPTLGGVLGVTLGSFLNVCALRWPVDESVVRPRSRCGECGAPVRWYDNLPVLSWLLLRGRCRGCRGRISIQYPIVEAAAGLIWCGMVWMHGVDVEALRGALFLSILLGIAVSDARFYIIPDEFSLGGVGLGLLSSAVAPAISISASVMGGVFGFVLLCGVAWAGEKAFKKEAMGGGDIKMMAMIGVFLGVPGVLLSLFLGALLGTVVFAPISFRTGTLVPFGVFLAVGGASGYLWGDVLVEWYLGWAFGA